MSYQEIKSQIGSASLVAVSKYVGADEILAIYNLGQRDFGENRVDKLQTKAKELRDLGTDITWHFVGRLQSNKIKNLFTVSGLAFLHSVDSISLLEQLYKKEEAFLGSELNIFLQVNTSGEEQKGGFSSYDDLSRAAKICQERSSSKIKLIGLMTMGSIRGTDFATDARNSFKKLASYGKDLSSDLGIPPLKLSMGMSQDFLIALEEGSDFVRIGSAIFTNKA